MPLQKFNKIFRCSGAGFTLMEVIIVTALVVIISITAFNIYGNLHSVSQINESTVNIIQNIRLANQKAKSGINNSNQGIKFFAKKYTMYEGLSYDLRNPIFDQDFSLENAIALTTSIQNNDLNFSIGSGFPSATGTVMILYNSRQEETISVNKLGIVE